MAPAKLEPKRCPPSIQDRLTRRFGRNQFGDPNWIIVWGQSQKIRLGHEWKDRFGRRRVGYRDVLQAHGQPCWVIMRWKAPYEYGSPATYFAQTYMPCRTNHTEDGRQFDSAEGFYVTAGYPYKGRYEIVQPLIRKEWIDGPFGKKSLLVTHVPISHYLVDVLIPMMEEFRMLSHAEQQAAKQVAEALQEKKENEEVENMMMEALPSFYGPVSFSHQGIRTSLLTRKMDQIQKKWDMLSKQGRRPIFKMGMRVGERPRIVGYR